MLLTGGQGGPAANGSLEITSKLVVATDGQGRSVAAKLILKPIQGDK
jgi:hypothetical protein